MKLVEHRLRFSVQTTNVACVAILLMSAAGCSKKPAVTGANRQEATLQELSGALSGWMMRKAQPPASVDDLTNWPALREKKLPQPPPGKKLAIDAQHLQVVWVNE
jgi:hypothetical protein